MWLRCIIKLVRQNLRVGMDVCKGIWMELQFETLRCWAKSLLSPHFSSSLLHLSSTIRLGHSPAKYRVWIPSAGRSIEPRSFSQNLNKKKFEVFSYKNCFQARDPKWVELLQCHSNSGVKGSCIPELCILYYLALDGCTHSMLTVVDPIQKCLNSPALHSMLTQWTLYHPHVYFVYALFLIPS